MSRPLRLAIEIVFRSAKNAGYRWALVGGFALPFHGVVRATQDVDVLTDERGAGELHKSLGLVGMECLQRSENVANYSSTDRSIASIDVLVARRPASRAMLDRARTHPMDATRSLEIPVAEPEDIIGLKVQAVANRPERRHRDFADVSDLLRAGAGRLDIERIREYFRLFGMEGELAALELAKTAKEDPS